MKEDEMDGDCKKYG